MKTLTALLIAALIAGCGDDEPRTTAPAQETTTAAPTPDEPAQAAAPAQRKGTRITLRGSQFGRMLFDRRRQAIYIFENDPKGKTVCYGECARAWPPVLTDGKPRAATGVRKSLLGTVRRRNGRRQVTYAGKPLYYYAHEGPGEVRCHNVNLNGGFWWVVAPDGRRRP
jgi:predicted lipoprotein with Yx(FWY)xxD motif